MPSVNERFTAQVRDISSEGNGIVEHPCGQVFFVPGVWKGEVAEFRITGFKKRFGFASVVKLLEPASQRVEPQCKHHGFGGSDCGGCSWQFMAYEAQLEVKEAKIRHTLERLGIDGKVKPIRGAPEIYGYRNRAQFKTDGKGLGYVAQGSKTLVAIEECPILTDKNRDTLKQLRATLPNPQFKPARKTIWNTIDIDEGVNAETIELNKRRPFRQGNDAQNTYMKEWLRVHFSTLDKSRPVLELFAGSGNFTEVIASMGMENILAVEGVSEVIDALSAKKMAGVEAWVCNLFAEGAFGRIYRKMPEASILVLDPPRDGLKNAQEFLHKKHKIKDIYYISCDLATFFRDIKAFVDKGFRLQELQPVDQLPHTPHLELLAHLKLKK